MRADALVNEAVPIFVELLEDVAEFPVMLVPTAMRAGLACGEMLRISKFFLAESTAKLFVEYAIASGIHNVTLEENEEELDSVDGCYRQVCIGYQVTFDSDTSFGLDRSEQPYSRTEDQFIVAQYLWGIGVELIASILGRGTQEIDTKLIQLGCRYDTNYFYDSEAFTELQEYITDMEAVRPNRDFDFPDWSNHLDSLSSYLDDGFLPFECDYALSKIGVNCFDRLDVRKGMHLDDLTQGERRLIGDYLAFRGKEAAASRLACRYGEIWRGYLLGIQAGYNFVPASLTASGNCPTAIVRLSQALEVATEENGQRSQERDRDVNDNSDLPF
jgi:hypothetical protein